MTSLVACLGAGKGTWNYLKELILREQWDSVFLVTDLFGSQNFNCGRKVDFILVDEESQLADMVKGIKEQLNGRIKDLDVAFNLVSGSGKEHMAVLSALLQLGLGIRLVALSESGIIEV